MLVSSPARRQAIPGRRDLLARLTEEDVGRIFDALGAAGRRPSGRDNWSAHSPFRQDRHRSFTIRKADGVWHDKATGEGGSIFDAVMRARGCDFRDALAWVAGQVGAARVPPAFQAATPPEQPPTPPPAGEPGGGQPDEPPPTPTPEQRERGPAGGPPGTTGNSPPPRRIAATYDYRDEDGTLLYQVVRFEPKGFAVRRPDGQGGWHWGAGDTPKVLYRLPELLAADPWEPVFFPEGEKDVDRLISHGLVATTNPHGAGTWDDTWARWLAGRPVVIIPDNDEPGRRHAARVAEALLPVAHSVKILASRNRAAGGDISDWFDEGGTARALLRLAEHCPVVVRKPEQPPGPLVLAEWAAEITPRAFDWLWEGWLPRGKLVILGGHPGVGKSTLAAAFAALLSRGSPWPDGRPAPRAPSLFLLGEDSADDTLVPRLNALGADLGAIAVLHGIAAAPGGEETPLDLADPAHLALLEHELRARQIGLVVIDPLSAFLGERNRNDEGEMRALLASLGRLARELAVTILRVMHVGKPGAGKRTPLQSLLGATAFGAYARTVLMAAEAPGEERGVLGVVKSNLARRPTPVEWGRDARGGIVWLGESARSIEALLAGEREKRTGPTPEAVHQAAAFLESALADGPRPVTEVEAEARAAGITRRTLVRTRQHLATEARKLGRTWYLALPGATWDDLLRDLAHAATAMTRGTFLDA